MTTAQRNDNLKEIYKRRHIVELTRKKFLRIKKGAAVYVVHNGIGIEIKVSNGPQLFTAKGKRITTAAAVSILKKMARAKAAQ